MTTSVATLAKKKTHRVEIMAEREWVREATRAAERWGLSLSAYIRLAVAEKMERDGKPQSARRKPEENGH